tara:strand:+ start:3064 stop:3246 length:183 start_codon:yes stop_codon:yes gene_type:complete
VKKFLKKKIGVLVMRKIYIGILLGCFWLQKKNWRRPSGLVWRITTLIGGWAAGKADDAPA